MCRGPFGFAGEGTGRPGGIWPMGLAKSGGIGYAVKKGRPAAQEQRRMDAARGPYGDTGQAVRRPRIEKREERHMLFIWYPKCTTCQKAKKWLEANGLACAERHIQEEPPTAAELADWQERSGLPLKRFFNTSGLAYKALHLKDRLPAMDREEQLALLASDGMLVKRPILVGEDCVLVGFREEAWRQALL